MGCLMRVPNVDVRQQICDSIISFYTSVASKPPLDGMGFPSKPATTPLKLHNRFTRLSMRLQVTSPGYRVHLLEQSSFAETMVLSLAIVQDQPDVKLQVLQTLQMLSSSSDLNCSLMLKAQGAETICLHMNEPDPSGQFLFRSSEILWNLLERGSKVEVTAQLSNMECIVALKEAFLHQMAFGYRQYDLQLRNDLLGITTLVAENPESLLIESLFAKQLILFATFPEVQSHDPLVRNLKLSYNNEDFEMKKLLLNLIVVMSKDPSALSLFKEGRVVLALLLLVKPPPSAGDGQKAPRHWTPGQEEELQLQALATLATIAPLMLEDYLSCQGSTCLLLLLEWCTERDSYFGQGHSFHATGGRGGTKAQIRYCVRLLRSLTSQGNGAVSQDLCDQGAINQLLGILMQMEGSPGEEEDGVSVEIKTDILLILSALCESDLHRKELFGSEGVEMAIHFLKMNPEKFYSGLGHNKLLLSTVDCVWSCIVGCYTTEDYFLAKEGVFLLLDQLQSSPRSMHSPVLVTLLELCDNPKTMSHILTWRGPAGQTAPGLLLTLWRLEELDLGVSRDQHGRIVDTKKPILSSHQEEESQLALPSDRPSAAVMDVSENLRSKIYCIFCKIGAADLGGLTTEDYISLSIVNRYLDFKMGEVWSEISRELALEGVRPITPDKEALDTIVKLSEATAQRVIAEQSSMLEQQEKENINQEKLLYTEISSNWKQTELTARSWDQYVAKTSDYEILKEAKAHQVKTIESSRSKPKNDDSIFHPTQISGLQTTNFCGRVITMESTPAHLTGGPLANTEMALERAPLEGGALKKVPLSTQTPEYFSTVSVK
ncbi:cilia- and flagella-associated protein 69 [Aplochiton taeniatus]